MLRRDYQPYPSPPFGYSYEMLVTILEVNLDASQTLAHNTTYPRLSWFFFFIPTYDFVLRVLWGAAVKHYESH